MSEEIYRVSLKAEHDAANQRATVHRAVDLEPTAVHDEAKSATRARTVLDVVNWCVEHGLHTSEVSLVGRVHLRWNDMETDEEFDQRRDWERQRDDRTERWEREKLALLKAKYEADS